MPKVDNENGLGDPTMKPSVGGCTSQPNGVNCCRIHTTQSGDAMTYNRMEAKPIAGEHCRFCGESDVPLVKTPCCQQWICCDIAWVSIQGSGFCQVEHERFSLCYFHYIDRHSGVWQNCQKCRDSWTLQEYQAYAENPINMPKY